MKNWGDFSSDDDSDYESLPAVKPLSEPAQQDTEDVVEDLVEEHEQEPAPEQAPPTRVKRKEHVLPENSPYTAYVGNLSFKIKTGDELGQKVADLVQNRLGGSPIVVTKSRVAFDRDGNSRGFGYVEVETLDMLKAILELDDGQSMIAGRPINLDAASPPQNNNRGHRGGNRRSSTGSNFQSSSIDGSQFRGGRYNNNNNNNEQQRKPSFKRQNSEPSGTATTVPLQRPSLKLKPRSQSVGLNEDGGKVTKSDIFGGAKARDHNEWTSRRQSLKKEGSERRQSSTSVKKGSDEPHGNERRKSERRSGRGGAGGGSGRGGDGRGGRGESGRGGRGGRNSNRRSISSSGRGAPQNKKQDDDKQQSNNSNVGATRKQKDPEINKSNKSTEATTAPANRFAGLFDDEDSD